MNIFYIEDFFDAGQTKIMILEIRHVLIFDLLFKISVWSDSGIYIQNCNGSFVIILRSKARNDWEF
jgi:hypothetical protein